MGVSHFLIRLFHSLRNVLKQTIQDKNFYCTVRACTSQKISQTNSSTPKFLRISSSKPQTKRWHKVFHPLKTTQHSISNMLLPCGRYMLYCYYYNADTAVLLMEESIINFLGSNSTGEELMGYHNIQFEPTFSWFISYISFIQFVPSHLPPRWRPTCHKMAKTLVT